MQPYRMGPPALAGCSHRAPALPLFPPPRFTRCLPHPPRPLPRPPHSASTAALPTSPPPGPDAPSPSLPRASKLMDWWHVQSPQTMAEQSTQPMDLRFLLKKIWELCAPDKFLLAGATTFMVVAAMAELAIPHFATTSIFAAGAQGATSSSFRHHLKLLGVLVGVFGVTAALRGYCFHILNNRMTMRLRSQLFNTLVQSEAAFFDANEVGSLTSRLQTDCQAITRCVATNLNIALRNGLQAVGGFIYLFILSKELCAATLAITSILWVVTLIYGNFARRTQKVYQDVLACSNKVADEVLSLSRIMRTFSTEEQESKRYNGWLRWLYQVALRQGSGYSLFIISSHIACYSSKVVALSMGCYMILQGRLDAEQLTNFIFYVEMVVYSSLNVCDEYTEFMEAVGASERVMKLLDSAPALQISSGEIPARFSGNVSLKDVVFSYPTRPDFVALDHVSIALQPGQRIALVGRSGSGKSSVVALLQRLYDPSQGAVLVDGLDLAKVDADWFRSHIGVVSQDTRLFGASVAANIAYGFRGQQLTEPSPASEPTPLSTSTHAGPTATASVSSPLLDSNSNSNSNGVHPAPSAGLNGVPRSEPAAAASASPPGGGAADEAAAAAAAAVGSAAPASPPSWFDPPTSSELEVPILASQEQIEEAAREANAHDFIMALPLGYQTLVNDKSLSGGQRQRIALARALVRKPNILILDEATSALDAESEAQVQVALDKAMRVQGRTVVVIAHRLSTVRNADVIYVMDQGKVAEVGDHDTLMGSRGLYWQLVMRQETGGTGSGAKREDASVGIVTPADHSTAAPAAVQDGLEAAALAAAAAAAEAAWGKIPLEEDGLLLDPLPEELNGGGGGGGGGRATPSGITLSSMDPDQVLDSSDGCPGRQRDREQES